MSESDHQIRELRKLWKHDKPPLIAHCGAFVGEETEYLFNVFEKKAKIVAFDPDPRNVEALQKKFSGHSHITVEPMAVGDSYRPVTFTPSATYKGRPWQQSGTVCTPTEWMKVLYPRLEFGNKIEVQMTSLDEYFFVGDKPDIIYCDVQGAEHLIIHGAALTLKHARLFFTEYYDKEIHKGQYSLFKLWELLRLKGKWDLAEKFPWEGDGSCGDALFERKD